MENKELSSGVEKSKDLIKSTIPLLSSFELWPKFAELQDFDRVIISWSSNSGKSFIATLFREHEFNGNQIDVVHRYTTRPQRKWKEQWIENSNITEDFFDTLKNEWCIVYRQRNMEKKWDKVNTIRYWFHSDEIVETFRNMDGNVNIDKPTYVYSANNDFVRRISDNGWSNIDQFKDRVLIIYVDANEDTRKTRMLYREDQMLVLNPENAEYRLGDDWQDVKRQAHIIIYNDIDSQWSIPKDVNMFIDVIFAH